MGQGTQKGLPKLERWEKHTRYSSYVMIDIVVKDDEVPTIKKTHLLKAPEPVISVTEKSLLQCEDVIRIRKGEEGNEAL